MPYATTDLGRLFVQHQGRGSPVTFWNCLFGDRWIYHPLLRPDSDGVSVVSNHEVVLVEGPSHGRSEPWRRAFTIEQCADAWVQALDAQGITEPAVFCGLSWGSMVALRVALRHPERVRGLFLMSTIATGPRPRFVPQFISLAATIRVSGFPDWLIRSMTPTMVGPQTLRHHPEVSHDMLARNRHLDRAGLYHAALSVLVRSSEIVDQLSRIHTPTWVLVGSRDVTTPIRAAKKVANGIEGAELRVLEGVGHLVPLEAPSETRTLLREALESVG